MHVEPEIVTGAKLALGYVTAAGAVGVLAGHVTKSLRQQGVTSTIARASLSTAAVFAFFEVLPHYPVGVSEVHFILGSTLFLLFGAAPAGIGLALGLLIQGLFFAPLDLPNYGMNVTTLLVPLFAIEALSRRIIAPGTAYVDLTYAQTLKLSAAFQGGTVAWVAFWVLYGQGVSVESLTALGTFASAYMLVVLGEPLLDLAVLAGAKLLRGLANSGLVTRRLYHAA